MSLNAPQNDLKLPPRSPHIIRSLDIARIICHRQAKGREQYLVRWQTTRDTLAREQAVCSWHALDELRFALHKVQRYLETRNHAASSLSGSRKRKSPESNVTLSRDPRLGVSTQSRVKGSGSVHGSSPVEHPAGSLLVYNGILERKEGYIVAKQDNRAKRIHASSLPTDTMIDEASRTPVPQGERAIREAFYRKVRRVPHLSLENKVDSLTPSLDFTFVQDYVPREGVYRADSETFEGCQQPCKPNMGQFIGCEYPRLCSCLEYAAVHESILQKEEPERYEEYMRQKAAGEYIDKKDLPKRFPYQKPKGHLQTLQTFYRDSRHPIYECNVNCKCGPACKSRVVQKGRKVPLTIFKTLDRGWGVYCREDLVAGEFIDTYLGEIITNKEADRRESRTKDKASYLYSLDKFVGEAPGLTPENCFVVDGQYMGGPTRFINHSCEPNCRQYTVSYNKHDPRVYDLAFFAIDDIPAGTELVFDYMDKDEEEDEVVERKREAALSDPENRDAVPCNCGARRCRGYLWV